VRGEPGMEALWRIEVEDFPAFIIIDDKGNDFFQGTEFGMGGIAAAVLRVGGKCSC
jgi:tartrate dehydratase beta subunit/fumarate hydratase class I family protein